MLCFLLESRDPFLNLALEELLLRDRKEEYMILGINDPSVIIGKHQVAHMEVNTRFVTENGIPVIRRISGGGTVYHDTGNLNFTFIRNSEEGKQIDFRKYTRPVIDFLLAIGINAIFEGKNDIRVDGLKISGNAEHVYRKRVLHHGTLLFNASLDKLKNALRSDKSRYSARTVHSNPSEVMNLNKRLDRFADTVDFSRELMKFFISENRDAEWCSLPEPDADEARTLADSRYRKWEWNFAYGPDYYFSNSFLYHGKMHSCDLSVRGGIVRECTIRGDSGMEAMGARLQGCRHMPADFLNIFKIENIDSPHQAVFNFF
jgi:lipoate-protein ligase A